MERRLKKGKSVRSWAIAAVVALTLGMVDGVRADVQENTDAVKAAPEVSGTPTTDLSSPQPRAKDAEARNLNATVDKEYAEKAKERLSSIKQDIERIEGTAGDAERETLSQLERKAETAEKTADKILKAEGKEAQTAVRDLSTQMREVEQLYAQVSSQSKRVFE